MIKDEKDAIKFYHLDCDELLSYTKQDYYYY